MSELCSAGLCANKPVESKNESVLVSLAVTPPSKTVAAGESAGFQASGTYSDGATRDVTADVAWSVEGSSSLASVDDEGHVTTHQAGAVDIVAKLGSKTAKATLTIGAARLVSIAITPERPRVVLGRTVTLVATGTLTDGSHPNVTRECAWSAANTNATVSNAGLVETKAEGNVTVSATIGAISGSTVVTILPAEVVSLEVTPENPSVRKGGSLQLVATVEFTDGTRASANPVSWATTGGTGAGTVSATGLFTPSAVGTVAVSATSAGFTANTQVTVLPPELRSLSVSPTTASVALGIKQAFTATGYYEDGSTAVLTNTVTWSTSAISSGGATIDATGLATSTAIGSVRITATLGALSQSATLNVNPASIVAIEVTQDEPERVPLVGMLLGFTAQAVLSSGARQAVSPTWSTGGGPGAGSLWGPGIFEFTAPGRLSIIATTNGISGSKDITVYRPGGALVWNQYEAGEHTENYEGSPQVAVANDGRVFVANHVESGNFSVTRLTATGAIDTTWTTDLGDLDFALDVALQADGKVLLAGISGNYFGGWRVFLVRYNANGSLDLTFSGDGILPTGLPVADTYTPTPILVQPDGKILVGCGASGTRRYNSDGTLDSTFGANGHLGSVVANDIVRQADGKLVFVSPSSVVRTLSNGTLDTSFDGDGRVSPGGVDAEIQVDGKIVVLGPQSLVRLSPNGAIDMGFANGGYTWNHGPLGAALALQTDGKVVVAYTWLLDAGVWRFDSHGDYDQTFNYSEATYSWGSVTLPRAPGYVRATSTSLAIRPNGDIVVGGIVATLDYFVRRVAVLTGDPR